MYTNQKRKATKTSAQKNARLPAVISNQTVKVQNPHLSSSLGSQNKQLFNLDSLTVAKPAVQFMPLTKADNITIKLAGPPKEVVPKKKIGILSLVSNSQSFNSTLQCTISPMEVSLDVYLKTSNVECTDKPMLSMFADLIVPYNILATANGKVLHIQQQHQHSGNTSNVHFLCNDAAEATAWASFINAPHSKLNENENQQQQQQQPISSVTLSNTFAANKQAAVVAKAPQPVQFTPVSLETSGNTCSTGIGVTPTARSSLSLIHI